MILESNLLQSSPIGQHLKIKKKYILSSDLGDEYSVYSMYTPYSTCTYNTVVGRGLRSSEGGHKG